jgi:hypothetical protein
LPARASLVVAVAVAVAVAACGSVPEVSSAPTSSPVVPPVAIACVGVPLAQCGDIAAAALRAQPVGHAPVSYMEVGPLGCQAEPCPKALLPGGQVTVLVEFTAGDPRSVLVKAGEAGLQALDGGDPGLFEVEAASPRVAGPGPHPFSLSHCGIWSPIDFDGSFWDPVGFIDPSQPAAINSAAGVMTLTTSTTAVFVTPQGFRLDLVRHLGAKHVPGCA